MFKVELTEKEVKNIGEQRYLRNHWSKKVIVFFLGLIVCGFGAALYELLVGKLLLFGGGIVWLCVSYLLYQKDIKAGEKFLEEVKNGEVSNTSI